MQREIEPQIDQAVQVLKTLPDCQSIWLLGSTARDEASFLSYHDGRLELFSDYEFMVVTTKRTPRDHREQLDKRVTRLERGFGNPNPLFHVDVVLRELRRLARMAPIIFTFEMKENAQLIYGEDNRDRLPTVTLENLDLRDANEILYKRLWAILLCLPKRFVLGDMSEAEQRVTGYVLCRNALDITTVLLPYEGILLPTYRQRVERITQLYPALSLATTFGPGLPRYLEACLARRLSLDFADVDLRGWYGRTIECLQLALGHILPRGESIVEFLPRHSRTVFNEWPISRGGWYNLARLSMILAHRRGPLRAIQWLRLPKKGWLTLGLLAMHEALQAWFDGNVAEAKRRLARAREILRALSLAVPRESEGDFPQQWLALRPAWGEFWRQYVRLGASSCVERFERAMEWTHD